MRIVFRGGEVAKELTVVKDWRHDHGQSHSKDVNHYIEHPKVLLLWRLSEVVHEIRGDRIHAVKSVADRSVEITEILNWARCTRVISHVLRTGNAIEEGQHSSLPSCYRGVVGGERLV